MPKIFPYRILHVHLELKTDELLGMPTEQNGYYLVFWWKDICLGDTYIEAGQLLGRSELEQKVLTAISPTIDFYVKGLQLPQVSYSGLLSTSMNVDFATTLNAIASAYTYFPLPEVVDISVVICTRNRSSHLKNCLGSLQSLTCKPKEIIVVDNDPSDDETKELVEEYRNIKYYREPRKGLDVARNAGAYIASCPVVAYVDDDVILHPLWAFQIWRSFLDKEISAVTGLVFASDLYSEAQQIFEKYWSFNKGYIDRVFDGAYFDSRKNPPVWEIGAGASMAFRKSVLETAGYFDERLDAGAAGCNGDSELWYRILLKGFVILYNPRVISHHRHRADLLGLRKQIYNYIRGHVVASLIQQKHNQNAAYHKYVYWELPKYYFLLFRCGLLKQKPCCHAFEGIAH